MFIYDFPFFFSMKGSRLSLYHCIPAVCEETWHLGIRVCFGLVICLTCLRGNYASNGAPTRDDLAQQTLGLYNLCLKRQFKLDDFADCDLRMIWGWSFTIWEDNSLTFESANGPLFLTLQSLTEDFTAHCHIRISIETDHILTSDHPDSPKFFSRISNLSPTKKPSNLKLPIAGTAGNPANPFMVDTPGPGSASPAWELRSCSYRGGTGWSFWPKMLGFSPTNAMGFSVGFSYCKWSALLGGVKWGLVPQKKENSHNIRMDSTLPSGALNTYDVRIIFEGADCTIYDWN